MLDHGSSPSHVRHNDLGQWITDASDKRSIFAISRFASSHSSGLDVPAYFLQLLLLIEDKRFPTHFGFDFWGVLRALRFNIAGGRCRQGASTISQQLYEVRAAKNGKKYDRRIGQKLKQLMFGIRVTYSLTKVEIIREYLDNVYWGGKSYGLDAASCRFFNKQRSELSVEESLFLVARLASPNRHSDDRIRLIIARKAVIEILETHQSSCSTAAVFCKHLASIEG